MAVQFSKMKRRNLNFPSGRPLPSSEIQLGNEYWFKPSMNNVLRCQSTGRGECSERASGAPMAMPKIMFVLTVIDARLNPQRQLHLENPRTWRQPQLRLKLHRQNLD